MAKKTNQSRRIFLQTLAQNVSLAAGGGMLWAYLLQQQAQAGGGNVLRPPGALPEQDFNAACIKCGQCVRACPYDTLKLAAAGDEIAPIGTPYFEARKVPCYMCPDIPCMNACPTGALSHDLKSIDQARMGVAVIDMENCISYLGLRCEICHRVCPVQNKAITIEHHPRKLSKHAVFVPVVHSNDCTGCGICEESCPTDKAAIRVVKPELVQGKVGEHYRLGWKDAGSISQDFKSYQRKDQQLKPATGLDYLNQGDIE